MRFPPRLEWIKLQYNDVLNYICNNYASKRRCHDSVICGNQVDADELIEILIIDEPCPFFYIMKNLLTIGGCGTEPPAKCTQAKPWDENT
jgi:hypothetical protein